MENPRPEKVARVAELEKYFDDAGSVMLTEYRGLDVPAIAELRSQLRGAGAEYKIFKNTLVRIAARKAGLDLDDLLTGPTAIAFVTGHADGTPGDPAAAAKALRDFAKTNDALVLKGGLVEGVSMSVDQLKALADLPSRDVLLAQFAGLLQAPMGKFAGLLAAMPTNLAYGLKALIDSRPPDAAPAAPAEVAEDAEPADVADVATEAVDEPTEADAEETVETDPTPAAEATTDETPADAGSEQES